MVDQASSVPRHAIVQPQRALRRLAGYVAGVQIVIVIILVAVILMASAAMNKAAFNAQKELIDNALDQYVTQVLNEQKSIAFWDETASRFTPKAIDTAWANIEVGAYLAETYGHREIYVLSSDDRSVYAFANGQQRGRLHYLNRAHVFSALIAEIREQSKRSYRHREAKFNAEMLRYNDLMGAKAGRAAANIFSLDGKPVVASAVTIVPTVDLSLAHKKPYILLSIVPIDQKVINNIGAVLLINDLQLMPVKNSKIEFGQKPLITDDGNIPAELLWTPRNPGRLMLSTILPLVLIAAIIAGGLTRKLLRRLVQSTSELAQREASARHQSLHDSLSNLPNRRSFLAALETALAASQEDGLFNIVAYVDIDRFKDINDTLGHSLGDELIVQVAARLNAMLAPSDHLARFGGDEFAILRRSCWVEDAAILGADIRSAVAEAFDLSGQITLVEVSVGMAVSHDHSASAEMLLRRADIALYDAKDRGRNCVSHFADSMAVALESRYALEADLRDAVTSDQFFMLYQPVIDAQSSQISGVEALVRWRHPTRGLVSPADFISMAERTGMMPALGRQIFRKVFADAVRWPSLEVSVNLSPAQIRDAGFLEMVETLLAEYAIKASQIVFEITEGVLLEATDQALQTLRQLTDRGFKIALDDFGTGYSSLSYLRQFEFHKLKIDRSFVQEALHKQKSMWIVQAIIALGTGLGMRIVAEGVETAEEAELMSNAGCNELQGYYFSKPIEPLVINAFFEDHAAMADRKTIPV